MIAVGVHTLREQLTISVCLAGEAPFSLPHSRAIRSFLHTMLSFKDVLTP